MPHVVFLWICPCCFMHDQTQHAWCDLNSLLIDFEPMVRSPVVWHWFPGKLAEPRVGPYPDKLTASNCAPTSITTSPAAEQAAFLKQVHHHQRSPYICPCGDWKLYHWGKFVNDFRWSNSGGLFISENIQSANVIAFQSSFDNDESDDWSCCLGDCSSWLILKPQGPGYKNINIYKY